MSKYIKRYPWLRLMNPYTGKLYSNRDAMDDMPKGWELAFGDMFCEELDRAIKNAGIENEFIVYQVKEKFGSLRFYCNHLTDEINRVITKYEALSENICINCGKPDVPLLNTNWIRPMCKECYMKTQHNTMESYESCISDPEKVKMVDEVTIKKYHSDKSGHPDYDVICIDTSETAEKIRSEWNNTIRY